MFYSAWKATGFRRSYLFRSIPTHRPLNASLNFSSFTIKAIVNTVSLLGSFNFLDHNEEDGERDQRAQLCIQLLRPVVFSSLGSLPHRPAVWNSAADSNRTGSGLLLSSFSYPADICGLSLV